MRRMIIAGLLGMSLFFGFGSSTAAPVRMAYLQSDIHHLALWVALENGFFDKYGTDTEVVGVFRAGPEIMTAFTAAELDMAYVGEAPATTAAANGTARVAVVAQVNTEGSVLVVAENNTALARIPDLVGKTVAIPGHSTVQDFLLKKALKNFGISPMEVDIMILKPPEMIGALRTGQIDAFIAWEPYPSKAETMGVGKALATSRDIWPDHPCCVLVAAREFIEKHPDQVKSVLRAHLAATDYIRRNPDAAARIGAEYTGMDLETVRRAMQTVHYTCNPSIRGEKEYVRFLEEMGYIRVKNADLFVDTFIDQHFLQEISDP